MTTGEGNLKPAAPTPKMLADIWRSWAKNNIHNGAIDDGIASPTLLLEETIKALEAPLAAERTALKEFREEIAGSKNHVKAFMTANDILELIDSKIDASEGTKSE